MKKRKLSCLLALITCLTFPLAACKDDKSSAMNEYFHWENARTAYSQVQRYDGEIVNKGSDDAPLNNNHDIAVIRSEKNLASGVAQITHDVINLSSGEKLLSKTDDTNTTYTVTVTYPVIKVKKEYKTAYMEEMETTYSYYLAKNQAHSSGANAVSIVENLKDTYDSVSVKEHYSLYQATIDGYREYWISEDLEILRSFNVAQISGVSVTEKSFKAAYNNYLYAWDLSPNALTPGIQVYNLEGICSMQYSLPSNVTNFFVSGGFSGLEQLKAGAPYVLNNGNIIIQEHVAVAADAVEYTYKMTMIDSESGELVSNKYDVTTKIIDYKTGEVKEIEVDYIICGLEAAYLENAKDFPAKVRDEYQNQAYIAKIKDHSVYAVDYVTLDCSGVVTHTVENEWIKAQTSVNTAWQGEYGWADIGIMSNGNYAAPVMVDGRSQMWIFDADGEKLAAISSAMAEYVVDITDEYIITEYGIYDYDMDCLYDFETSEFLKTNSYLSFEYNQLTVEDFVVMKDKISIGVVNVLTQEYEYFEFDGEEFEKVEGAVTIDANDYDLPEGNSATVEVPSGKSMGVAGVNTVTWTLYDEEDEPLLKMQVEYGSTDEVLKVCKDVAYVETEVDGQPIVYVVK